jgi:hypothetical protein
MKNQGERTARVKTVRSARRAAGNNTDDGGAQVAGEGIKGKQEVREAGEHANHTGGPRCDVGEDTEEGARAARPLADIAGEERDQGHVRTTQAAEIGREEEEKGDARGSGGATSEQKVQQHTGG